jgi:hypothetical protein
MSTSESKRASRASIKAAVDKACMPYERFRTEVLGEAPDEVDALDAANVIDESASVPVDALASPQPLAQPEAAHAVHGVKSTEMSAYESGRAAAQAALGKVVMSPAAQAQFDSGADADTATSPVEKADSFYGVKPFDVTAFESGATAAARLLGRPVVAPPSAKQAAFVGTETEMAKFQEGRVAAARLRGRAA